MSFLISGIQQIGIGVPDVHDAWAWYRRHFGMDIPVFEEKAEAALMTPYTGNEVQSRHAVMAFNMGGGAGMEIWQYTSREAAPPAFDVQLGDYGIYAVRIKSKNVRTAHEWFQNRRVEGLSELLKDPAGNRHFFVRDPHGNIFQVVPGTDWFSSPRHCTGGVSGCLIGVSDIERARTLYSDLLGYDEVVYDESGVFEDFESIPGKIPSKVRRVLLRHSKPRKGSFSRLLGASELELVKAYDRAPRPIFQNRYWGDMGFIHLCFDVRGMDDLEEACRSRGFPFTVDSMNSFDIGEASGRFSYIEDPDGVLIEFVEPHRVPIMKKWGWYLDLRDRDPEKSLPDCMLKTMRLNRVKE